MYAKHGENVKKFLSPLIRGYAAGVVLLNVRNEAWLNGDSLYLSVLVKIKQSLTFTTVRGARRSLEDAENPAG